MHGQGIYKRLEKELHDAKIKIRGLERKTKLNYDEVWDEAMNAAIGILDASETEPSISSRYDCLGWSRNQLKKMKKNAKSK